MVHSNRLILAGVVLLGIVVSQPSFSLEKEGYSNESEIGIVLNRGNSSTDSVNLGQENSYIAANDIVKGQAKYQRSEANDQTTAKNWNLGLRYERSLSDVLRTFVAQGVEGNTFSGISQKYGTDLGAKYIVEKRDYLNWLVEAGYRYALENRVSSDRLALHYLRGATELSLEVAKVSAAKVIFEILPNLTDSADWQSNLELSFSSLISDLFSMKVGYLTKFDNQPAAGIEKKTDSLFTTALVAKW